MPTPRSRAFLATNPAPIITNGFDVLVQEVIAAIATAPSATINFSSPIFTHTDFMPSTTFSSIFVSGGIGGDD